MGQAEQVCTQGATRPYKLLMSTHCSALDDPVCLLVALKGYTLTHPAVMLPPLHPQCSPSQLPPPHGPA
jgi:hypothetical protein